ncbi:uncharacterized protein [Musca autumnalis]|uniref:uncharacterized protein n=1 Tax=Musca autumnalis TaxID=221902 RepID=UPI003CEB014A
MFKIFVGILALVFLTAEVSSRDLDNSIPTLRRERLARLMLSAKSKPDAVSQCFDNYAYDWNKAFEEYGLQYDLCFETADNATKAINQEVAPDVAGVVNLQETITNDYSKCNPEEDSYDFFSCSGSAASDALANTRSIQSISNERMEYITNRRNNVRYDRDMCTRTCKQKHDGDLIKAQDDFEKCISGETPPSRPSSTTASPSTKPIP